MAGNLALRQVEREPGGGSVTTAIRVEGLTKLYRRAAPGFRLRTLKSALLEGSLTKGLRAEETIRALSEVSFEVEKGKA